MRTYKSISWVIVLVGLGVFLFLGLVGRVQYAKAPPPMASAPEMSNGAGPSFEEGRLVLPKNGSWETGAGMPREDAAGSAGVGPAPSPEYPGASDVAHPPATPLETVDRILESLRIGTIAFNAPAVMNINDTVPIQLLLSLSDTPEELKAGLSAEGSAEAARIRVSDRMEARLTGPDFAITAVTPEVQAVSAKTTTEWKWDVKPESEGSHVLHLTLSVLLRVGDSATPRAIRTFDKMIVVEVTWKQKAFAFLSGNWQWLWAAILVPFAGWLWKRRRTARSPDVPGDH